MAENIVLDLAFRVVSEDQRIFIAFPGRAYKHYELFISRGIIFPEIPAIDLVKGVSIDEQPDLIAKIKRSDQINRFHNSRKKDVLPSRNLSAYDGTTMSGRASASSWISDPGRCSRLLFLHRLFRKPETTFRDDALVISKASSTATLRELVRATW